MLSLARSLYLSVHQVNNLVDTWVEYACHSISEVKVRIIAKFLGLFISPFQPKLMALDRWSGVSLLLKHALQTELLHASQVCRHRKTQLCLRSFKISLQLTLPIRFDPDGFLISIKLFPSFFTNPLRYYFIKCFIDKYCAAQFAYLLCQSSLSASVVFIPAPVAHSVNSQSTVSSS